MAVIQSSDLDFDQLKESLKTYLQRSEEFSDYDFEASGLSNILDVLAYNTHLNGLIANFAVNEAFLGSAQLRSSVLSHAETLGYTPSSQTGATATVNLTVNTGLTNPPSFISLPANTTFTTQVDDISYSFQTLEQYIGYPDENGLYTFQTSNSSTLLNITEGTLRTKTFLVGDATDNQVYVIPDETLDASTVSVKVYDTASSAAFSTYVDQYSIARVNTNSQIYILRESPNGFYELIFSNGNVLGQAPQPGNKIVVEYLSTSGEAANGASVFVPDNNITINEVEYPITVTLVSDASGGAPKETIESIKANATQLYATQQRLVTAGDYKALILSNYGAYLDDVSAWGGNENVPPVYGKVFISLKFKQGISAAVQTVVKDNIARNLTDNLSIMSIDTEYVDPTLTYLEIQTVFNFNPDLSGSSPKTVENQVQSYIVNYFAANLDKFGTIFRRSNVLSDVDDLAPAILNSRMNIKAQQRITPVVNTLLDYNLAFPMAIANPDDENYIVTSTKFTLSDQTCTFRNRLGSNTLQIVDLSGNVIIDNTGSYNPSTGDVNIVGFNPTTFEGDYIKISVVPANESTIKPLRNYTLNIDESLSFAQANIDYEQVQVSLS